MDQNLNRSFTGVHVAATTGETPQHASDQGSADWIRRELGGCTKGSEPHKHDAEAEELDTQYYGLYDSNCIGFKTYTAVLGTN